MAKYQEKAKEISVYGGVKNERIQLNEESIWT